MSIPDERFNLAWYKTEVERLEADNARLRAENESLRSANRALESDNYNLTGNLAHAEAELAALRVDIEAGRMVRVPLPDDAIWAIREGKLETGNVVAPEGIWVNFSDVVYSRWENGRLIYNCGTWQEQVFPTEQAARAAMEDDIK